MLRNVKNLIQGNKPLLCLAYVALDTAQGLVNALGWVRADNGAAHAEMDVEGSVRYIETVYGDYLTYAGMDGFRGTVAEIGPGDNFGVALLMLNGGAENVVAIDRFYSRRDERSQNQIYRALSEKYGLSDLFDGSPTEAAIKNLQYTYGKPAETCFAEDDTRYDAIVSRAVFEHLYDPVKVLGDTTAKLRPGGVQVHEIDLRDHGMFAGHHPLTFLTVPRTLYRLMTKNAGRPNRVMSNVYRSWLEQSGLEWTIYVKGLVGVDEDFAPDTWDNLDQALKEKSLAAVRSIRPEMSDDFAGVRDEDLAPSIIIVVMKNT